MARISRASERCIPQGMPEHRGRSKEAGKDRVGAASMEDEQHLLAERRRKVQYARAVKHFNRDPKLALQLLEAEGLISGNGPSAARQIAEFLKIGTRMHISKTELGEFLGEKNDLCEQVLKEYALLFDFGGFGKIGYKTLCSESTAVTWLALFGTKMLFWVTCIFFASTVVRPERKKCNTYSFTEF